MLSLPVNIQAILIACLGWLSFSLADVLNKWLGAIYPVHSILFVTGAIGMTISLIWLLTRHGMKAFDSPYLHWHLFRGCAVAGGSICVVNALKHLPLTDFYGIVFLAPFGVALVAHFLLKEHVGWVRVAAMLVAFLGVLVLAQPQYDSGNVGLFWSFGVPIMMSCNALAVRKIGQTSPLPLYALFPFLGMAALNGVLGYKGFVMPVSNDVWMFFGVAILVLLGQVFFSSGFRRATLAAIVAPFLYTQVIWGIIGGYLVFGDVPTLTTFSGLTLIIGAGLFSFYREYRLARKTMPVSEV